jgi:hypothetical protein
MSTKVGVGHLELIDEDNLNVRICDWLIPLR